MPTENSISVNDQAKEDQSQNDQSNASNSKNALEWTVFVLSVALISSMLVYMGIQAYNHKDTPPRLTITLGTPTRSGKGQSLVVSVENSGQTTAQNVEIEVASPEEKGGFTLPYVPREGQAKGFVTFEKPVTKGKLTARVVGYTE